MSALKIPLIVATYHGIDIDAYEPESLVRIEVDTHGGAHLRFREDDSPVTMSLVAQRLVMAMEFEGACIVRVEAAGLRVDFYVIEYAAQQRLVTLLRRRVLHRDDDCEDIRCAAQPLTLPPGSSTLDLAPEQAPAPCSNDDDAASVVALVAAKAVTELLQRVSEV